MSRAFLPTVIASILLCSGCAPKADLDKAQTELTQLRSDNARLGADLAQKASELEKVTAELAKRSAIPLKVGFRKAVLGPGLVAVIETTIKGPVAAIAVVKSAELSTSNTFELHVSPAAATELGHREKAVLQPGDTMTFQNNEYTSLTVTVPSP